MKSIFYNPANLELNQNKFSHVKNFIREQEHLGNKVLLPKINEDVIFVQHQRSNFIKVYSIKQETFVRMFDLYKVYCQHQPPKGEQ